jgi:pimeloyl-ACP methyl ester carboxylesterase
MLLASCGILPLPKSKLDVSRFTASCNETSKILIVMLPGRFDSPKDLEKHGFVDAVKRRGINADIVIPDLNFGYYLARTVVDRLHEDVVLPAKQERYAQIWLAGISLGGWNSLTYARNKPGMVDEIMLIAPFLGSEEIHREIANADGVRGWQAGQIEPEDYERSLWAWIKDYGDRIARQPDVAPRVYLGVGVSDRFAASNRLFADVLPASRVMMVEGGHDWLPWLQIWEEFLDRKALPGTCHR